MGQCGDLWHQYWEAVEQHSAAILILIKSHVSEWSLWSGHQPIWMSAGNEFADRLAPREPRSALRVDRQENCGCREVWPRRCRGALPPSPCTRPSSTRVAVARKRTPLEECIRLSAHEIVAGRRISSVMCTKCLQVCGKKQLCVWLATACVPWKATDALVIAPPPGQPAPDPADEQF